MSPLRFLVGRGDEHEVPIYSPPMKPCGKVVPKGVVPAVGSPLQPWSQRVRSRCKKEINVAVVDSVFSPFRKHQSLQNWVQAKDPSLEDTNT